jgi:hypothetical protein
LTKKVEKVRDSVKSVKSVTWMQNANAMQKKKIARCDAMSFNKKCKCECEAKTFSHYHLCAAYIFWRYNICIIASRCGLQRKTSGHSWNDFLLQQAGVIRSSIYAWHAGGVLPGSVNLYRILRSQLKAVLTRCILSCPRHVERSLCFLRQL